MLKRNLLTACSFIFILTGLRAQISIGAQFSTFNVPSASFKTMGFGITGQLETNPSTALSLTLGYFAKTEPLDSIGELAGNGGSATYYRFQDKFSFLTFSANFHRYLIGSTSPDKIFSVFVGAGVGIVYSVQKTSFVDLNPPQTKKATLVTGGFEFYLGADVKLGFAKLFVKGRANFMLKHIVPVDDATSIPLLANTQIGLLVPLKRDN